MADSPEIRALRKAAEVARSRPALIDAARKANEPWEAIAEALGISRAGAIKMHNLWKSSK